MKSRNVFELAQSLQMYQRMLEDKLLTASQFEDASKELVETYIKFQIKQNR